MEINYPQRLAVGRHRVDEAIVVPKGTGGRCLGEGSGMLLDNPNSPLQGKVSAITGGGFEGPLIQLSGTDETYLDMTLAFGDIGMRLVDRTGLGSGKLHLGRVMYHDLKTAIQCGEEPADNNCDIITGVDVSVVNCDTFLKLVNAQSMGHRFLMSKVDRVGTLVEVQGGGCVYLDAPQVLTGGCTIFRLTGDARRTGTNNGKFICANFKADSKAYSNLVLCESDYDANVDFAFIDGTFSRRAVDVPTRIYARGKQVIHVVRGKNVHKRFIRWNADPGNFATIVFSGCRLEGVVAPSDLLDLAGGNTGTVRVLLRDCTNLEGEPINDGTATIIAEHRE